MCKYLVLLTVLMHVCVIIPAGEVNSSRMLTKALSGKAGLTLRIQVLFTAKSHSF